MMSGLRPGGGNLEVIADGGLQFNHQFEVVGGEDFVSQVLKDRGAGVVRPDAQGASGSRFFRRGYCGSNLINYKGITSFYRINLLPWFQ
jgi:hypothetical protein